MLHPVRFGALYLLLGGLAAVSIAAFVLGLTNHSAVSSKASKASVQAITNPSRDSAVKAACEANIKEAASAGVILTSCKIAPGKNTFQQKGDIAQVVLLVSDGETNYTVVTVLNKGVWNISGLQVVDASPVKK